MAAKRIAFKHSVELSSTTINLRIKGLHSIHIMPGAVPARNAKLRQQPNNMAYAPSAGLRPEALDP